MLAPPAIPGRDPRARPTARYGSVVAAQGVVVADPRIGSDSSDPTTIPRVLCSVMCITVILTTPAILSAAILWLAVFMVFGWLLSRLGLSWLLFAMRAPGRQRRAAVDRPITTIRITNDVGQHSVVIPGDDADIQIGDTVRFSGFAWAGQIRARSVHNLSTGTVHRRRHRLGMWAWILVDVALALVLMERFVTR